MFRDFSYDTEATDVPLNCFQDSFYNIYTAKHSPYFRRILYNVLYFLV